MAFPYVRHSSDWKDAASATGGGDESTPLTATAMDTIEAGIESLSDIFELADAAGDILVASAADAWAKLAKGSDDEVLSVASGALDYRKVVNAMVDAAAAIAYSKLNLTGSLTNADVSAASGNRISMDKIGGVVAVTALPGSPVDGQMVIFTDSLTAPTYQWLLQYLAAKSSNKWLFIGGVPAHNAIQDETVEETTTSTTYAALSTAGPSFAIPVAGDYLVDIGFTGGDTAVFQLMSYDIGGTGAIDADAVRLQNAAVADPVTSVFRRKKKALTALTLTAKYRSSAAGTASYSNRILSVTPIAIGG